MRRVICGAIALSVFPDTTTGANAQGETVMGGSVQFRRLFEDSFGIGRLAAAGTANRSGRRGGGVSLTGYISPEGF